MKPIFRRQYERGFSMVEMLMAAFILAVGLLGLASLQMMAMRTAGTGARMTDAVRLGELALEAAAAEGTQSLLGLKYTESGAPPTKTMAWITPGQTPRTIYFGYRTEPGTQGEEKGSLIQLEDATGAMFTVNATQELLSTFPRGSITKLTVEVVFTEGIVSGTAIPRKITLFREVIHA